MDNAAIRNHLAQVFEKVFGEKGIEITDDLAADKVSKWDSLTHLTMIAEVEKTFGIKFKLKELVSMKNVGDLIGLITTKTST